MKTLAVSSLLAATASAVSISDRCTTAVIGAAVEDAFVEKVAIVKAGEAYGEGASDLGFPGVPTELPELCAVTLRVNSSETSSFRFGVFLPTEWNSRMLTLGNGGFGGGINWLDMGAGVKYGFAAVSTDTGHNSTIADGSWADNNPEARLDFGYRAIHGSVEHTKTLVKKYYQDDIAYSYYAACSTGGRQGMRETQSYPDSFDGALIGAPAWWSTHLQPYTLKSGLLNGRLAGDARISYPQFIAVGKGVIEQCDGLDGVLDGIVSNTADCKLDYDQFKCGVSNSSLCLSDAQLGTLKQIYEPWIIDGKWQFPGMNPSSEDLFMVLFGGEEPNGLGTSYVQSFVLNNVTWPPELWNDSMLAGIDALDPGLLNSDNFTGIANFRDKGGKVIMYHGLADSLIPPGSSDYLYNTTAESLGEEISSMRDWFRFFHVPGMGHCSGTFVNAPAYFAGANQAGAINTSLYSVPGFHDPKHDALLALMDWVENGTVVDSIIATAWKNSTDPSSGVLRQRPLCPVPQVAKLTEGADEKLADSWTCV